MHNKTSMIALTTTAIAAAFTAQSAQAETFSLKPSIDARLRYENVDQPTTDADAVTMRMRPGITLSTKSGFSALVEAEATLAIDDGYTAFPGTFTPASIGFSHQRRAGYSVVSDPENIELNRAQIQYKTKTFTLTGGRQRINLDDQRFVGSVGWRQNEQTFDAVRAEATLGPISLDGTYSWSQRTIFGVDAGSRQAYSGGFVFLGAGASLGPVKLKAFSYLLDFDAKEPVKATSTQTYGARATSTFKLSPKASLNLMASYARQYDYELNPGDYSVDYIAAEAGLSYDIWTLTAGYELLGGDITPKGRVAFQTPMATLHKFNGWADLFLNTPTSATGTGLEDIYAGVAVKPKVKSLAGLNAAVVWHSFKSDVGNFKYGQEWDAQIGFKPTKSLTLLAKYADYDAKGFLKFPGDVDTSKFWLQLEYAL
ncbi:alginate export family protein [Sphingobium sp. DEHP117]|uniref:alginate export family protein n=1 Tax=Sphingobium sp. DEHP117 TaxID=2993436 RepID=UPI0027D6FBB4|nr:alginate export family protein [Sphingobium sp. DEHP117]MDQ4418890.1 alginate export family protein [Sphingobium sp. DEHP117]